MKNIRYYINSLIYSGRKRLTRQLQEGTHTYVVTELHS